MTMMWYTHSASSRATATLALFACTPLAFRSALLLLSLAQQRLAFSATASGTPEASTRGAAPEAG